MGFGVTPFLDWVFGLRSTPKIAPRLVHQFWEPNSHAVPQFFFREIVLTEQVEVPPGSRRAVGHRIDECLPFSGIFDLLQLLRQVEIIPADDAVLDEPLAGLGRLSCRQAKG